jgi:tyrosine-specific transport protein
MIISFGYHNLIPTLNDYMAGDAKRLRLAIIIGSSIPLAFYLLWELLVLGLIPAEGPQEVLAALDEGEMVTRVLKMASGSGLINLIAQSFAFFAIVTSFLGVGISLIDFMADGLHIHKTPIGKGILCLLTVIPPLLISLIYPGLFLTALNYAGGFAAVTIFGILPAWMAWVSRKPVYAKTTWQAPGGTLSLILVAAFALFVIAMEAIYEFVL